MTVSTSSPKFHRFFPSVLMALHALGGSAKNQEITKWVLASHDASETDLEDKLNSGASRIINEISWAKVYLQKFGLIMNSGRGVWALTELAQKQSVSGISFPVLWKEMRQKMGKRSKLPAVTMNVDVAGSLSVDPDLEIGALLIKTLKTLSPSGFEQFCQRLLREYVFENVEVTGKSGDGGIDGIGILRLNPLVGVKVVFQCKRFDAAITPSAIRDFRGAMSGRTDKGLFLTTSRFTADAQKEAARDGVVPIELVDGEKLAELMIQMKLGVRERFVVDIDPTFFNAFSVS
jgi:restriction system protein